MSWPEWVIVALTAWTTFSFLFAFSLGRILGDAASRRIHYRQDEAA